MCLILCLVILLLVVPASAKNEVKESPEEGQVEVKFTCDQYLDAQAVHVAGEFNDWQATSKDWQMKKKNGVWTITKKLAQGTEYQYKFTISKGEKVKWIKDKAAEKFKEDGFGGKNSVVVTKIK